MQVRSVFERILRPCSRGGVERVHRAVGCMVVESVRMGSGGADVVNPCIWHKTDLNQLGTAVQQLQLQPGWHTRANDGLPSARLPMISPPSVGPTTMVNLANGERLGRCTSTGNCTVGPEARLRRVKIAARR